MSIWCGHVDTTVLNHDGRLEFGVDRIPGETSRGLATIDRSQQARSLPRRAKRFVPGWPKGWPKPPTWTYTWLF